VPALPLNNETATLVSVHFV